MNRIHAFVAAPLLLGLSCTASPADPQAPPAVSEAVESLMPGVAPAWLKPSPMAGLWEVALGPHIFYISSDGEHLLRGDIVSVGSRENLTRPARNKARLNAVESLGEDSMIVFTPASAKYTVSVFTDVDCGDDQRQAMTDAKAGRDLAPQSCKNPVDDHFEMGQLVGVRGTPTIVLQTGDIVPGYVPADRLLRTLREVGAVPRS
jgi:thiol:disulfide interchange protein DsbC